MTAKLAYFALPFSFDHLQQVVVVNGAIGRLLLACLLGGVIGLQREINRKDAGVRTNLLISMGASFFTLLSAVLAGDNGPKGQVASNIVQGIGFLGAGLIIHNRNRVNGLTSAACVWVVASIGMACGAGLYAAAIAAMLIVILGLQMVGILERWASLKRYPLVYEARGHDQTMMTASILDAMDKAGERLCNVEHDAIGELQRVSFVLTTTRTHHDRLLARLRSEPAIDLLLTFRDPEED